MAGRNSGICHNCRGKGHYFDQCQSKHRCPDCKTGFQKCFEVEKETANKGKLFKCCNEKCCFWQWVEEGESSGTATAIPGAVEAVPEVEQLFQAALQLKDDEEIHISLNMKMTITKRKSTEEGNDKGKGGLE
ncbi:unnamed protein product [Fraxinus pennsylvanica]|uniref:CCHC-type domain-containing protein n=1 Tax=Fraxinus pennsylvanica TaxID=56036 RepID=A0AAD2A2J5_9LAMI|nr:unnamed protein product [Fraxinus pennsylvanica]